MIIQKDKEYKTLSGDPVEIYKIDVRGDFPVIGAYQDSKTEIWYSCCWTIEGKEYCIDSEYNANDLVEFPKFKIIEFVSAATKTIHYFGHTIKIHSAINWIATDDNGFVYGYFGKPILDGDKRWKNIVSAPPCVLIASATYSGDFKNSLMEVRC
jgi:hypothetical protein